MGDFIVRFVRADQKPDEEYYYNTEEQARAHFDLFRDDDSERYSRIELTTYAGELIELLS